MSKVMRSRLVLLLVAAVGSLATGQKAYAQDAEIVTPPVEVIAPPAGPVVQDTKTPLVTGRQEYAVGVYTPAGGVAMGVLGPATGAQVVQGVAGFVSQRAQQELIQWFLDGVLDDFCEAKDSKKVSLFPNLCKLREASSLSSVPSRAALISSLKDDIDLLPGNLLRLAGVASDDAQTWNQVATELFAAVRARRGESSITPRDLLRIIAALPETEAIKSCSDAEPRALACLLKDVGSAVQAYLDARGSVPMLAAALSSRGLPATGAANLQTDIAAISARLVTHYNALAELRLLPNSSLTSQSAAAFRLAEAVAGGMESIIADLKLQDKVGKPLAFPTYWRKSLAALAAVSSGDYARAAVPLSELISEMSARGVEVPRVVTQYAPLAVDLLTAESDKEVKSALEAAASPLGAWRLKRAKSVVSVGALVGLFPQTTIGFTDGVAAKTVSLGVSAFAPIGLDVSFPMLTNSTFGVFVSALDVGAIVAADIYEDNAGKVAKTEQNTTIKQVFAPGAYLRLGLGRTPLVLALGGSWTSELKEVSYFGGGTTSANALRLGVALAVDVTFLPF